MVSGAKCKIIIRIVQFGNHTNKIDFFHNYVQIFDILQKHFVYVLQILILYRIS